MTEPQESPVEPALPATPLGEKLGKPRGRRLHSLANVKSCLGDVIRAVEGDRMEPAKARVLIYALSTLASIITGADIERRVRELETRS